MVTFTHLLAPFLPFVTEAIYQNLVRGVDPAAPESIHHVDWPQPQEALLDESLIEAMGTTRTAVTLGLAARASANLKVRQPLSRALVHVPGRQKLDDEMIVLIADELNVKAVEFVEDANQLLRYRLLPDNRKLGPRFGTRFPAVRRALTELNPQDTTEAVRQLESGGAIAIELDDGMVALAADEVLIQHEQPEGLAVTTDQGMTVAVDTQLTPELVSEGLAREVVRHIQNLRKAADFKLDDRIITTYQADEELWQVIADWSAFIANETLSLELRPCQPEAEAAQAEDAVSGLQLKLGVRRANV
jgi:isoleucyl-tRNA synthetase